MRREEKLSNLLICFCNDIVLTSRTFSPWPIFSSLTSLSVFQLTFSPLPTGVLSVRDWLARAWPCWSYLGFWYYSRDVKYGTTGDICCSKQCRVSDLIKRKWKFHYKGYLSTKVDSWNGTQTSILCLRHNILIAPKDPQCEFYLIFIAHFLDTLKSLSASSWLWCWNATIKRNLPRNCTSILLYQCPGYFIFGKVFLKLKIDAALYQAQHLFVFCRKWEKPPSVMAKLAP